MRGLEQRGEIEALNELPVFSNAVHQLILLKDIATVEKRTVIDQPMSSVGREPAIVMYGGGLPAQMPWTRPARSIHGWWNVSQSSSCPLYPSDAADVSIRVRPRGRRIIYNNQHIITPLC